MQVTVTVPLIMYMPDEINWGFETLTNLAHRESLGEFMLYPRGLDLVNVFGAGPLSKLLPVLVHLGILMDLTILNAESGP